METGINYPKHPTYQPPWSRILLLIVLAYEGLGALVGGTLLILRPDGHLMDMPIEIMNGVFADFYIPGLILFGLGLIGAASFISVLKNTAKDWFMAALALGGFTIWFIVEIIILRELHWLHLMWGLPVLIGLIVAIPLFITRNIKLEKSFLKCGIAASIWYFIINIYVPIQYNGYSVVTHTVSELSALEAPTRILWVLLVILYPLLFAAFGWGVLHNSKGKHSLRVAGALIIIYSFFNLYWPPMHMRGHEPTLTDTLHIAWASLTVLLMMVMMIVSVNIFSKRFRSFTIISLVVLIAFGLLTSLEAPEIPGNGPTPMIGVWERINISVFIIWVMVFANNVIQSIKVKKPVRASVIIQ